MAYALSFGLPWCGACLLGDRQRGSPLPDDVLERARERLAEMVSRLTAEQKPQVDNLVISAWLPMWFYAAQGIGKPLATDAAERDALLSGFEVLARA
jgi:hypothetical protein